MWIACFYMNSDIVGGNLASSSLIFDFIIYFLRQNKIEILSQLFEKKDTANPRVCSELCLINDACKSWVWANGACFMKTGTTLIPHASATSGIKCGQVTGGTNASTTVRTSTNPSTLGGCDNRCQGSISNFYGCNPSFEYAYCNSSGGCSYAYQLSNSETWCCIKNC